MTDSHNHSLNETFVFLFQACFECAMWIKAKMLSLHITIRLCLKKLLNETGEKATPFIFMANLEWHPIDLRRDFWFAIWCAKFACVLLKINHVCNLQHLSGMPPSFKNIYVLYFRLFSQNYYFHEAFSRCVSHFYAYSWFYVCMPSDAWWHKRYASLFLLPKVKWKCFAKKKSRLQLATI